MLLDKWKRWQYYIIIATISLIALFILPLIGSEAGLAWKMPNTVAGWIVYVISKLLVATINILIFHCFILQAKSNVQNNKRYCEAVELLMLDCREIEPRSPNDYFKSIYGKKILMVFTTSMLSAIGLTQAVLTFDWIAMITYFFTIIMGLIFGILQMNATEEYWTEEFYNYAKMKKNREVNDNADSD